MNDVCVVIASILVIFMFPLGLYLGNYFDDEEKEEELL